MAYAKKAAYGSNKSRPSNGGASTQRSSNSEGTSDTTPTHYIKGSDKEFVQGVFLWENLGEYGPYIKVRVTETLQAGDYFISARKGHLSQIVNG